MPIQIDMDLITPLTLLYFVTLHADRLHIQLGGMAIRYNNLIALCLALLLATRFYHKLFIIDRSLLLGLGGLSLSFLLSTISSLYPARSSIFLGWWAITVVFYIFLPYCLLQILSLKKILSLYFLSFIIVGLYAMAQIILSYFGIIDPFIGQFIVPETIARPNGFCYEPSYYALYMTPFVMMVNLCYIMKIFSIRGIYLLFVNFLFLLSTATSTLFAYLLFFMTLFLFSSYLKRFLPLAIKFFLSLTTLFLLVMMTLPSLAKEFFFKFFYYGFSTHSSFFERWFGIVNGFTLMKLHPYLGTGLGSYPYVLFDAFLQDDQRFIFGHYALGDSIYESVKHFEPSNVALEIASTLGVVGTLAFTFFGWLFFQRFKNVKEDKTALAFFLSSLVMVLVLQFNQGLFRTYIWVHLALSWAYYDATSRLFQKDQDQWVVVRNEASCFAKEKSIKP